MSQVDDNFGDYIKQCCKKIDHEIFLWDLDGNSDASHLSDEWLELRFFLAAKLCGRGWWFHVCRSFNPDIKPHCSLQTLANQQAWTKNFKAVIFKLMRRKGKEDLFQAKDREKSRILKYHRDEIPYWVVEYYKTLALNRGHSLSEEEWVTYNEIIEEKSNDGEMVLLEDFIFKLNPVLPTGKKGKWFIESIVKRQGENV